jgi:AmmeMemoRadiSam system protein B
MMIRGPAVAGQFYPAGRDACVRDIQSLAPAAGPAELPARPVAGVVPHAGWFFSGPTALAVLGAILSRRTPETFVLFGAVHYPVRHNAVFVSGAWETPLGMVHVDEHLAQEILAQSGDLLAEDPKAHENEHSLEVQMPFIRHLAPDSKIVPITVRPGDQAVDVGRVVGQVIRSVSADAVCIGSSDLTHYGPAYGFVPQGEGPAAIQWVRDENDRRMIDLMTRMDAEGIVPEAHARHNACGAGAVAATIAAARELGATRGYLVNYTTSYDVMREKMGRSDTEAAVGYAGVVF